MTSFIILVRIYRSLKWTFLLFSKIHTLFVSQSLWFKKQHIYLFSYVFLSTFHFKTVSLINLEISVIKQCEFQIHQRKIKVYITPKVCFLQKQINFPSKHYHKKHSIKFFIRREFFIGFFIKHHITWCKLLNLSCFDIFYQLSL